MRSTPSVRLVITLALACTPVLVAAQAALTPSTNHSGPRLASASVAARPTQHRDTSAPLPAPTRANGFASSGFAQFMSSPAGRVLRVVAGAGMIGGGIAADSKAGTTVAIVGAVPLLAGSFDFCVLSPLFGGPLRGKDIRAARTTK